MEEGGRKYLPGSACPKNEPIFFFPSQRIFSFTIVPKLSTLMVLQFCLFMIPIFSLFDRGVTIFESKETTEEVRVLPTHPPGNR